MRLVLRILSALVLTLVAGLVLLTFIPGQKLAELAGQQIEKQTGRQVVFGGDVHFSIWPSLGIRADNVALANADWAGPEPMFTAGRLVIGLDAAALIGGDVHITEVSAIVPHLNLQTRADGTNNWTFTGPMAGGAIQAPDAPASSNATMPVVIEALSLSGASLKYVTPDAAPIEMKNIDLSLQWPDPAGAASLNMTVRPYGDPIEVSAELAQFERFLQGEQTEVVGTLRAPDTQLSYDGQADLSGAFKGRVSGKTTDSQDLLAALGLADMTVPKGLGQAADFAADVTYDNTQRLSLRALDATLDGNTLRGQADIVLSTPPQITASLKAGNLDLHQIDASSAADGGSAADTPEGWSKQPIDASVLSLMNGTVALEFETLKTASLTLGASAITTTLDRARAVVSLAPARAFGGTIEGDLIANNRDGLSVAAQLRFADIQLQQALATLADYDKLTGVAQGHMQILGVGNSLDAIMHSLNGKGDVAVGKGFFTGFDLQSIMDRDGGNGGTTIFNNLSASYVLEGGTLTNQDFAAALDAVKAVGTGRVGIGEQDLDYTFTPTAFATESSTGLSVPVRISGAWADPKIRPDLSKLAEPELKALEEKTKAALQEKLNEELGTKAESVEDINEALKRKVEEEARKQLLQFLGSD